MAHLRPSRFALGIDLGTTYSCVGVFRDNAIEIISNEHGEHTTPSCVAFTESGRFIGAIAKEKGIFNPSSTVFDIKRLIGRQWLDPAMTIERRRLPFKLVQKFGRPAVEVTYKGETKIFTPEEISAMILGKLKAMAELHLGLPSVPNLGCVVTVPSTFNIYQREATRNACFIAGLNVFRTVSEPTAAAYAYDLIREKGNEPDRERVCLVFDLGGGTLGATLLTFEGGFAEVKSTAGDDHLGGEDFDHRLVQYLADTFISEHKKNIMLDSRALSRLRAAAERAKRVLSSSMQTTIEIESLHDNIDFVKTITRGKFEGCCQDIFTYIRTVLDKVTGSFWKSRIDDVLLVGGSTRIPKIRELVSEYFKGKELNQSINPDEAATFGASILAATLAGDQSKACREKLLMDALSMPILVHCGSIDTPPSILCNKNDHLPFKKSVLVSTDSDNQDTIKFRFFEGDNYQLEKNLFLCELEIDGIAPAPKGVPKIEVTADIDANYLLMFTLTEKGTGRAIRKMVNRSLSLLSEDDLSRMRAEANRMKDEDEVDAERAILKSTLEMGAYSLEDQFTNLKLSGSISSYLEEQVRSFVERLLLWIDEHPQAPTKEYQTQIERMESFSRRATKMAERSITPAPGENDHNLPIPLHFHSSPENQNRFSNNDNGGILPDSRSLEESSLGTLAPELATKVTISNTEIQNSHVLRPSESNPILDDPPADLPHPLSNSFPSSSTDAPETFQGAEIPDLSSPPPIDALSREATATPTMSIEKRLGLFFIDTDSSQPRKYSDSDFENIALLLRNLGRYSWSLVPRIYTVLRRVGQLQLLDEFVELGITDFWFPFTTSSLPGNLSPTARNNFVETQHVVITVAIELEAGPKGRHANFGRGDSLPFEVIARLGSGGYGNVDKVISLLSHREYARKSFRRKKIFGKERDQIRGFLNELKILKKVRHDHCVELIGSYTDPRFFALIMSPVANCNLAVYYTLAASSPDKLSLLRSFYGCLANALHYLHDEQKIRHRDIKPENILVNGSNVLLTDFGLSFDWEHLSRSTTTADSAKTPVYAAPEVAFFEPRKNSASDIWSLGCVFLEMVTVLKGGTISGMREFFKEKNDNYRYYDNLEAAKEWSIKILSMGLEEDVVAINWIAKMLQKDPSKRLTAAALFRQIVDCDGTIRFCGPCCDGDDDTDETDDTSDDHDLWADTAQETIKR